MTHPLQSLVRYFEARSPLSDDDRRAIAGLPHSINALRGGDVTLRAGDAPETCVVVLKGFAGRQRQTEQGRQIVSIHVPGEPTNLQHLAFPTSASSVRMLTAGVVAVIPAREFSDVASSHPAIGQAILASIAAEASIAREWLLSMGRRDASQRIGHLLCELAIRLKSQGLADLFAHGLPLKHNQLADILGLTPVHVGRILKRFAADGLVANRKQPIALTDWNRMCRECGFDPAYLHFTGTGGA